MQAKQMLMTQFGEALTSNQGVMKLSQDGDTLVKIIQAGVCHGDVQAWQGHDPQTLLPVVPGHEGVGQVVDVQGTRTDALGVPLAQGDLIVWRPDVSCGECHFCRVLHEPEHCPWRTRYGATRHGSYAEYQVVDARTDVLKIDPRTDVDVMNWVTCAGATIASAMDACPPRPQESVLIVGAGSLGMCAVAFAKVLGVSMIMVVGSTEKRLQACRQLGATHVMSRTYVSQEERLRQVRSLTEGRGADWVLEAGGTGEALREAVDAVRAGGVCLTMGRGMPGGVPTWDGFAEVAQKGLTLRGVGHGRIEHLTRAHEVIQDQAEVFRSLVTHRFKMDRATEALQAMGQPDAVKAVLMP